MQDFFFFFPLRGIEHEKKGLLTSVLGFYFLNSAGWAFFKILTSAYSLSTPYFPENKLSDLVSSVKWECHPPLTEAFTVEKTQYCRVGLCQIPLHQRSPTVFFNSLERWLNTDLSGSLLQKSTTVIRWSNAEKKGEEYVLWGAGLVFIYYPLYVFLAKRQETLSLSWYFTMSIIIIIIWRLY